MISALILAGGDSTRMGRDKASLPFGTETLLERVARLVSVVADETIVSARLEQTIPAGVRVVYDAEPSTGPLVALARALAAAGGERTILVACDMPLLQPAVLSHLLDSLGHADLCVPIVGGRVMITCAVLRTAVAAAAARALVDQGERRLRALADRMRTVTVAEDSLRVLDPSLSSFVPCNTPDEYRQALGLAGLPVNTETNPTV